MNLLFGKIAVKNVKILEVDRNCLFVNSISVNAKIAISDLKKITNCIYNGSVRRLHFKNINRRCYLQSYQPLSVGRRYVRANLSIVLL